MATLAAINETLTRVDDNTETTSKGINSFVNYLRDNKRKDLEAAREAKNVVTKNTQATAADATQRGGKSGGGLLDGVRNILAGASLAKLAPLLGKTLLKRVLGPAAIAMFAEDIVEYLLPEGFENTAIKDALTGGLQGAAIGFAVGGPLGAAIGAGIGALMKNEKFKAAITELGKNLKDMAKDVYDKIEPTVVNFKNQFLELFDTLGITKEGVVGGVAGALKFIGDAAASGVESLNKVIKGDFGDLGENIGKAALFVGSLIGILKIGKIAKLFKKLGALGLTAAGGAILSMFKSKDAPEVDTKPKPDVKPKPGSVVKSASGKLMLAGADGQATVNKAPPGSKIGDMPKKSVLNNFKKFPKLGAAAKFLRAIPGVSMLMSLGELATMNPLTVDGVAGVLGGLGGGTLGAMIGTLLPGIPGLNTLVGGTVGYFLGDALFKGLAQFLLGKKVDAFPEFMNDLINGKDTKSNKPSVGSDSMRMGRGGPTQTFNKPAMTSGADIKNSIQTTERRPDAMDRGAPSPTIVDNSSRTNINNNSSAVIGQGNIIDIQDQFLQYT